MGMSDLPGIYTQSPRAAGMQIINVHVTNIMQDW